MNEEYGLERRKLINQCHSLISAIARRPGHLKLLTLAQNHLEMLAAYKTNRRSKPFQ
jgi:hypothetical protein